MKREIKFRVWDKEENKFFKPVYEAYDGRLLDLSISLSGQFLRRTLSLPAEHESRFPDKYELNQFTGLKDKNGVKIYEGDIVRWDDMSDGESWRVAKVEINPDIQFKIVRIVCDFIQSAQEGYVFRYGKFTYKNTEDHLEVIGNIYEHKHLLE